MKEILKKYLPESTVNTCIKLIKKHAIFVKIVNHRFSVHGDYRRTLNGQHLITINASLNKYKFLITLLHEIAHLVAVKKYGKNIKPHGIEWKKTFQYLMLPHIHPSVFPQKLLPIVANHFKNPKASTDTDAVLSIHLKKYDAPNDKTYIYQLPLDSLFKIYNGKTFKKGVKKIKRYECVEVSTGKIYLFQPNAEVELLNNLK